MEVATATGQRITFWKETEFKDTEIGRIPKEWKVNRIGDIITLENGKRPPHVTKDGKYPIYGANGIMGYTHNYLLSGPTIVIGRVGASGEVHYAEGKIWVSDNAIYISSFAPEIQLSYLFFTLKKKDLRKYASQTTHPLLTQNTLEAIKIPLPPLDEQKAIAHVLSTIDKAIELTDKIIDKTERVKQALMNKLLTEGIGHTEFKDTEIGRIPKEWEVVRLSDVAEIVMGQSPPSSTYNTEGKGLPFLQGSAEFGYIFPSPTLFCSSPIKIAKKGSILISVRAPVGDLNIANAEICIGRGLAAIIPTPKVSKWYLFYTLMILRAIIKRLASGSTFEAITKEQLETLKIPLPPLEEQKKIAQILLSVDKKLEIEQKEKGKLERIKRALMDILLTGKVRVRSSD